MNFDNLELNNYLDDDLIENYSSDLEKELADINNAVESKWIDIELSQKEDLIGAKLYTSKNIELHERIDNNRYIQLRISNSENWYNTMINTLLAFVDNNNHFIDHFVIMDNYISNIIDNRYENDEDASSRYVSLFTVNKNTSSLHLSYYKNDIDTDILPKISFRILDKKSFDYIISFFYHDKYIYLPSTFSQTLYANSFYIMVCSSSIDNDEIILHRDLEQFVYFKIYEFSSENIYIYVFADINKIQSIEDVKNILISRINNARSFGYIGYIRDYDDSIGKKLRDISRLCNNLSEKFPVNIFEKYTLCEKNILLQDPTILSVYF